MLHTQDLLVWIVRVLNILFDGTFWNLTQKFVDYLIDAGHNVYVAVESSELSKWQSSYNYGVTYTNNIDIKQIDYAISLSHIVDKFFDEIKLPKIIFDLDINNKNLKLASYLNFDNNNKYLITESTHNSLSRSANTVLDALTELFIDTIIYLSRINKYNVWRKNSLSINNNKFIDFINYFQIIKDIEYHNTTIKTHNDLYNCQYLRHFSLSLAEFKKITLEKAETITATELQIITLGLMVLFNGRKEGAYVFDYYEQSKQITKFVALNFNETYASITDKLENPYSKIFNNFFYASNDNQQLKNPDVIVAVCYHATEMHQSQQYTLNLIYNPDLNTIQLIANQALIDTTEIILTLNILLKNLYNFKYHKHLWSQFLQVPEETIIYHFEKQAKQTPNEIAVCCGTQTLTYAELNDTANQLARFIKTFQSNTISFLVVLYIERSLFMPVALLAILKAGGAYIPLDLRYPDERIEAILQDSKPLVILTNNQYFNKIEKIVNKIKSDSKTKLPAVLSIDNAAFIKQLKLLNIDNLGLFINKNDLAYIIYTSGTTGIPKGVMIEHQSLINLLVSIKNHVNFTKEDRLLSVTTIAFDIAALEFFLPILNGGKLFIATDQEILDPNQLISMLNEHKISFMQATPSLWSLIIPALQNNKLPIRVLSGGENISISFAKLLLQHVNQAWNVYGPTETTIWSTIKELKSEQSCITIGYPLANTTLFVLDDNNTILPAGAIGELHIGGVGLARGYLNKPELTHKQFINYYSYHGANRLYKTGDLVRQFVNGEIEYIARKDFQVKINGFRIELGEIEHALISISGIKKSIAVIKSSQNIEHIVAYYVADHALDEAAIRQYFKQKLPEYMIPPFFVHLKEIPISINGKIDRKLLPQPIIKLDNTLLPKNKLEFDLWRIWSNVLGLEQSKPDIKSDFFSYGGNSMLAIRLVNKINRDLKADIKISDIFRYRCIEELSAIVQETIGKFIYEDFLIKELDRNHLFDYYPLNNVQQAYVLGRFNNFELSNISTHIYTEYSFKFIDSNKLEKAFNILLNRHLALRTICTHGQQYYLKEFPYYTVQLIDCAQQNMLSKLREDFSHKLYDVETYPLFDIFISIHKDKYILHISFDAFIIDMSSFQILFDEWIKLYNNLDFPLPELHITHRDYALQYERIRSSQLFKKAEQYWDNKINAYNFDINLPLKVNPLSIKKPKFVRINKTIPQAIWQNIVRKSKQYNISLTAVILEVYGYILSYYTGQEKLCINLTLFNRLPLHAQMIDIIGDFTVLELFNYQHNYTKPTILSELESTHRSLLVDIENNLFDGIDVQRLIRTKGLATDNQVLAPIVLTSVLGNINQGKSIFDLPLNDTYMGVNYAISQTPQVWLDNKAYETEQNFIAEWDYVEQLFDKDLIKLMHDSYCKVIIKLADLEWDLKPLPKINSFNKKIIQSANKYNQPKNPNTLFSQYKNIYKTVASNIAIIDCVTNTEYSHLELWNQSELLARYLTKNFTSNKLIAVLSQKGYNQAVATLAIMKAGCAYLPLNIDWPVSRIIDIMNEGSSDILMISRQELSAKNITKFAKNKHILIIEDILTLDPELYNDICLPTVNPSDIAYVIFTSGSTGKPKGVTISHQGALNTIDAINKRFNITSKDKVLALSELSFDLSVYDIFGLLAVGGTIVFPIQEETKNPNHWLDIVQNYQITIWNTVPQLAMLFTEEVANNITSILPCALRLFLLSGDWIPLTLPLKIKQYFPNSIVMSLGGATEGSIWSIWYEIHDINPNWTSIPYGFAMPNQKMYVLNQQNNHCPIGVSGEIHIGGIGLALNYWGDSKLTNEKFINHPELGRLYKTGDLGKWHYDGYIEFLGRKDFQVKIRGYRVELGEIEAILSKLTGINKAVVSIQQEADKNHLVAYIVPKQKKQIVFDKYIFSLEQHGILNTQNNYIKLPLILDRNKYRARKSYRKFLNKNLLIDQLETLLSKTLSPKKVTNSYLQVCTKNILINILSTISGLNIAGRSLPKYLYPSAGSSYSIRCFLSLNKNIDDLIEGNYYYHPTNHNLIILEQAIIKLKINPNIQASIHLVVHWPAITKLYGEFSKKLAFIEVGHMLSLITNALENENTGYEVLLINQELEKENTHLVTINIGNNKQQKPGYLPIELLYKTGAIYQSTNKNNLFDLDSLDVFTQANEFGSLLQRGQAIITTISPESPINFIAAGMTFQTISEALYLINVGSCSIGFMPLKGSLYSMVLGAINEQDKLQWDSKTEILSLESIINTKISKYLPDYMLPAAYLKIDNLPLSINGKLDLSKLPKIKIYEQQVQQFIQPNKDNEIKTATIWSEILGIAINNISMNNNFFKLGGNSLSAMQAVRRLSKEFGIKIKLEDFYKHHTIQTFLNKFESQIVQTEYEEGII